MKTFKRELSFLLVAALVISSIMIGFGTVTVHASDQAAGQMASYMFQVRTSDQGCDVSGTANNLNITIYYSDGTSATCNTIPGESSPNYFEAGNTDTLILSPTMPAKPVSSINFNSMGGTRWKIDWANFYYSPDGGSTWLKIATMGGQELTQGGTKFFTYPSDYSLNTSSLNKTLTFDANGGTGGKQIYSEYGATLPASNIPTVTKTGYMFAGWLPTVPATGPNADTTYTAQWTPLYSNITFDANGGTGGTGPTSMHVGSALTAPAVERTDYTFVNWLPAVPATVPVTDATYTAQWRETNPAVTFDSNGGSAVEAITPGYSNAASKPADPVKAGFTFGGWYKETGLTTPVYWPVTVTQSVVFYARWNTENNYTMIFDANGGTGGTSNAMPAGDPLEAPAVARTGYTFAGWSATVPAAVPAENSIYIAQWAANTYTVSYDGNSNDAGSTASSLHTYDTASNLTANGFTKVGNSLIGWSADAGAASPTYTDGQSVLNLTPNQGAVITFYAVWSANYYTITFNANGGSGGTSSAKQYGTALAAPTVTRTGYTFASWSPVVPSTVPAGNATYTAQWSGNQYTVTFDPQGGTVSPSDSTVTYGSTYGAGTGGVPTPTKTGYTFGGWYTAANGGGSSRSSTTTVTTASNHTLYAKWTGIGYGIAYNGNGYTGGSMSQSWHYYGTAQALTANGYTNTGLAFAGWATSADGPVVYSDKQSVLNLTETNGVTITLYAKWTDVNVATVTFDANGGTGGTSTTLIIGSPLTAPTVSRTGYTFASWSPAVPSTVPAENTTYTAQWTARTFTVTFNPQSGTVSPTTSTVTYDSAYGAGTGGWPTPVRTGYTFDGWFTSSGGAGTQIFSTTVAARTSSQTLYAKWIDTNSVLITFDANGGSDGTYSRMTIGSALTAPTVTRTGYTLTGWSPTVPSTVPSVDTTYTAQWAINQVYLIWNPNGGTWWDGSTGSKTTTTTECPGFLTRTGYTFTGWSPAPPPVMPAQSSTVTAQWTINQVTIIFDANGGTGGTGPTAMTPGTALTAPTVTRTGYMFNGWSPTVPAAVPAEDTTYTAQWLQEATDNLAADINLEVGRYTGDVFTPLTPGETLYTNDIITVRIAPTSDFLCGVTRYIVMFSKNNLQVVGSGKAAFTPNTANTFYATVCNDYQGATSIPQSAWPAALVTDGSYAANNAVAVNNNATSSAPNGGYPGYLPGEWLFRFDLKVTQDITAGSGAKVWMDNQWVRRPVNTSGQMYFTKCLEPTQYSASGSSTIYNFNVDLSGANISLGVVSNVNITFAANGGTGGTSVSLPAGDPLTAPTLTRTGYTFTGWSPAVPVTVPATNTTYTAQWTPNSYTVNYNGNGGTGVTASSSHTYDFSANLTANGFTKTDASFLGWSTNTAATAADYTDGQSVLNLTPNPNAAITFYAVWATSQYTITFNANGGSGSMSPIQVTANTYVALPRCTFTKTGYTFSGWASSSNGGLLFGDCSTITVTHDLNLYAKWTASSVTITFDANGGTGGTSTAMTVGAALTAPTVTRTGYSFTGWSPLVPSTVPAANTTYTAQWVASTPNSDFTYTVANGQATVTKYNGTGGNVVIPETLGGYPVTGMKGSSSLSFPPHYTAIFSGCTVPTVVTLPTSLKTIGSYAFYKCSNVTGVTIPNGVTSIAEYAFYECRGLTGVTIPDSVTIIKERAFYGCTGLTGITIGNGVVTINGWAFYGCSKLTAISLPNVSAIEGSILSSCSALTSVHFGNGVQTFSTAFSSSNKLTQITVSSQNMNFSSQDGVLFDKNKTTIVYCPPGRTGGYIIPDNVTTVAKNAFRGCKELTSLTIPASVTTIITDSSPAIHDNPKMLNIFVAEGNNKYSSLDGVLFNKDKTIILKFPNARSGGYTIPGSVTRINNNAFSNCTGLTSVIIPESVTALGGNSFYNCSSLTTLTVPSHLLSIEDQAFWYLTKLTGMYFLGNAPSMGSKVFVNLASGFTVYHLSDKTGFTSPTWNDYPTAVFTPVNTITFDANGGTGGTSAQMAFGTALTPPVVSKAGYLFAGWSPSVPATVPAQNATYTAQYYPVPAVQVTKLADGFKVNIKDWVADYKYQIWSYQSITSDLFSNGTDSQWILSNAYTPGSGGTAEPDGSISFMIAGFTSPDSNYTVAVRIADANSNYIDEVRDTYTPEDVQEVKITKVLVDGEYSEGMVLKAHDASSPTVFTVIGNNVPGTVYTAKVFETGAKITASNSINFSWDTSVLAPGIYTVYFTGSNSATTDTKSIKVQLYSLNSSIQYGAISSLGLSLAENSVLPKTLTIDPNFTNGSFYYSVGEPGRKAMFTSGLFDPADTINYTFTKYGIYRVAGYVNREYEVKIGGYYDDGYVKQIAVSRSQTEPSSAAVTANADITKPVDKATPLLFTASANIGGIGATPVQYSFWRYDAKGYALVKDWSSDNTLDWTPARVGIYTIEARAKGADAGSYEAAASVTVTVTDGTDQIAQGVVITLNAAELNTNAQARVPITVKAGATSTNSEDLLYKFNIGDSAMGIETVQNYSADSNCVWTPRKAGTYTISVLVKNQTSFGAYDAMKTFEITVN